MYKSKGTFIGRLTRKQALELYTGSRIKHKGGSIIVEDYFSVISVSYSQKRDIIIKNK